jgi:hypothetical protein
MPDSQGKDIQKLKTDTALIKQEVQWLRGDVTTILENQRNMSVVPESRYQADQLKVNERLSNLENYQTKYDKGITFINRIYDNIITAIVLIISGGIAFKWLYDTIIGDKI